MVLPSEVGLDSNGDGVRLLTRWDQRRRHCCFILHRVHLSAHRASSLPKKKQSWIGSQIGSRGTFLFRARADGIFKQHAAHLTYTIRF